MIYDHISKTNSISKEDIVQTKFDKPSKIDNAGKRYRNNENTQSDIIFELNFNDLPKYYKKKVIVTSVHKETKSLFVPPK